VHGRDGRERWEGGDKRGQDGWRGGMRTKGSKEGGRRIMRQQEKDEEEDCSSGCELLWKSRLSK